VERQMAFVRYTISMPHPLALIHPRSLKHLTHYLQTFVENRLWAKILIGLAAGILVGWVLSPEFGVISAESARAVGNWVALPGTFFLTMIQMIVVPLVFASVIRGIAATDSMNQLKKVGVRLVVYFLLTTTVAVTIGIGVAQLIKPGFHIVDPPQAEQVSAEEVREEVGVAGEGAAFDLAEIPNSIISILPQNPLSEAVNANMLAIVLFSVIVGLALVSLSAEQSKPLLDLLGSIQSVSMAIVRWVMYIAPLAVFGLIAQLTMTTGVESLAGVALYVITIVVGLMGLLAFYFIVVFLFTGTPPWRFIAAVRDVQLLAFSTGSSAAVMPLSIKTAEERLKVRPAIAQFVVPVGATVNMDATAMFQGAATIFLTQVYGLELSVGVIVLLVLTIIGSSIGTPATPGVGVIILSVVLKGVGVPVEGVALIIGVDRVLEMLRTSVNVTGDLTASMVMNKLIRSKKTYEQAVDEQEKIEKEQEQTGEDTLTGHYRDVDDEGSWLGALWSRIAFPVTGGDTAMNDPFNTRGK